MTARRIIHVLASSLLALALIAAVLPPATLMAEPKDHSGKIEPALLQQVQKNLKGQFDVIVTMQPGKSKEAKGQLSKAGAKRVRGLEMIGGASGSLSGPAILALASHPNVSRISDDARMVVLDTNVTNASTLAVRAPAAWALGYTGKGIGVAVLDSGIAAHPDLVTPKNRIIASVDVTSGLVAASDGGGHGTLVAGIIAGNGSASGGARKGIAPDANVVSVKVTTDTGLATYSSVISGIQWVMKNRKAHNIRVVNISLGAPPKTSYKDNPLDAALEVAWFSGLVVVVAAGNGGPNPSTILAPANDPYVVSVGGYDDMGTKNNNDDVLLDFSSRGPTAFDNLPKPDLVAPGRKVISLRTTGSFLDKLYPDRVVDGQYFRMTGTSMSAPVVAGVVALLLEKTPQLSPNQVKNILMRTTKPISDCGINNCGRGGVDAEDAVKFTGYTSADIANKNQTPSNIFANAVYPLVKGTPLVWRNPSYMGRTWSNYTWDTLPWDNYTWDNFSWETWANYTWDNFTWDNFTWDNYTWANYTWDNFTWDNFTWDNFTWDNFTWDNFTWDNFTWDNFTWDNFTWDNFTWDNFTWDNFTWDNFTWDNFTWD